MEKLLEELANTNRPVSKILRKTSDTKIIAMGLNTGVELKNHQAPGPTKLFVIDGVINYITDDKNLTLGKFSEYEIPLKEVHAVKAVQKAVFLLIIG